MKNCIIILSALICMFSSNAQNNQIDKKVKDTIFFEMDDNYLQQGKYNLKQYYIKDALIDTGSSEVFFLQVKNTNKKVGLGEITDLKAFIRNSEYYDDTREKNSLDDFGLASHLGYYVIYLVDLGCEPIKVSRVYPGTEID